MTEIKMENGRSMVEMLSVLAVAGVLSIGGVAGYRYAIDKMNANDIINEVKKRAVTASQQRILGQNINLSEYGDNGRIKGIHAVTATNDYAGDKGFFALTVSNVPQRVCDEILKQDWAMPVETAVGEFIVEDDTVCDAGDNEMLFAFHNTLDSSRVPGEENGDESDLEPCEEGKYRDPTTGKCVVNKNCGEDEFLADIQESGEYQEKCYPCSYEASNVEDVPMEACTKCSNRVLTEEGLCLLACGENEFRDNVHHCISCSDNNVYYASATECAKCDDTDTPRYRTSSGYCALPCDEGYFANTYGTCISCSNSGVASSVTAEECAKCDNTDFPRYLTDRGDCALTSCDSGDIVDEYGSCHSCSYHYTISTSSEECAKCDNRILSSGGKCAKICGSGRFMAAGGSCYLCSNSSTYQASAEECAMCDNTNYPRYRTDTGYCALPCDEGYFANIYGTCFSCSTTAGYISTSAEECAKCDDTETPRYMSGSYCYKKS